MRFWLLGSFRVSVGSRSVVADHWRLKEAESLVKLLALARGHRLHRERREVALLVARGFTNRRIAKELSISQRTVDTHVGRILQKLGIDSRELVAGRLVE